MLGGLITTKDVVYFMVITGMFLTFTIFKLKGDRDAKSPWIWTRRYVLVLLVGLSIGYITSRPALIGYLDTTADQTNTLTPQVQEIIGELGDEPLQITAYSNLLDRFNYLGLPTTRNRFLSFWEPYTRFKPGITFDFVHYYDKPLGEDYLLRGYPGKTLDEIAAMRAKSVRMSLDRFEKPGEIRERVDLTPELNRFVMHLRYKDRSTFLRVFDDLAALPGETEVAAAVKRLQGGEIPKVAFLTGHFERDINKIGDREYKTLTTQNTFRYALINQGFDVDTLSLENEDVPGWVSTLVIADPRTDIDPTVFSQIQRYIARGGNLLIMGELDGALFLNPLLEQFDVRLSSDKIVGSDDQLGSEMILAALTATTSEFTKDVAKSFTDSLPVSMPGAAGLEYTDGGAFAIEELLTFGTEKTALALTRHVEGKEQRIIITGDADLMSNSELTRRNVRTANFVFNTALFSWLNNGEFPVDTSRPDPKDDRVTVGLSQMARLNILFVWVMPAILLVCGSVLLIRRKRK